MLFCSGIIHLAAVIKSHAKLFTSMSAALINLIIIMMLTKVIYVEGRDKLNG